MFDIPYFKIQYQTIILILAKGIKPLPYEIVLQILKDYVYIKPFRIGSLCYESYPCQHNMDGDLVSAVEIKRKFIKYGLDIPKHFNQDYEIINMVDLWPDECSEL